ncbi:hypothetical protein BVRB_026240, partial [Beta vulgaris subsp. vulgaris]
QTHTKVLAEAEALSRIAGNNIATLSISISIMLAMIVMMAVGLSTASAIITQPTNVNPINVHLSADHSDPDQQRLRGFFVRPDGHWINFGDGPDLPGVVPVVPSPATETLLVDLAPNEPVAAAAVVPAPSVETLLIDLVPSEPVVAAAVVPVPSAEIHLEPSTSVSAKDVPVPATTKTFLNVGEFLQGNITIVACSLHLDTAVYNSTSGV